MAAESSFDIVSEFDRQELLNAIDQTQREARTRFDLKDSRSDIKLDEKTMTLTSDSEMHLQALRDILESKAVRRGLSIKVFDYGEVQESGGMRVRQVVTLRQGIAEDTARKIQKLIREHMPKAQARIQGDALRVSSKSKDDLQGVIRLLRERSDDFPMPLQFNNYR